jgi:hypothetical protein
MGKSPGVKSTSSASSVGSSSSHTVSTPKSSSSSSSSRSSTKSSTLTTRTSSRTSLSSTSSRSSSRSSSHSSSSSATAVPTPTIKQKVGTSWTYYGCQTEATSSRALSSKTFIDYTSMTLESCATNCQGYSYFGVEYAGECYCGNTFQAGSIPALNSDCSMVCPGDGGEFCGAGNRLSVFAST